MKKKFYNVIIGFYEIFGADNKYYTNTNYSYFLSDSIDNKIMVTQITL